MKAKNLVISIFFIFSLNLFAGNVTLQQAKKVALNFYYEKYNQFEGKVNIAEISVISSYTESESNIPYYYVFHISKGGYVVVSAENLLHPVIAYSFNNEFDTNLEGSAIRELMGYYKDMINFVRKQNESQRASLSAAWKIYLSEEPPPIEINKSWGSVGPLLTTCWNQNWPYNYYCPATPTGGSGGHVFAGCVATAIEQIAYYHRWPDHGRDSLSYIPTEHPEYGVQSADFENTWYRYEEMTDLPETVNLAIAELLYHMGVANRMEYDPDGSAVGYSNYEEDSTYYYFKFMNYHDHSYYRDSTTYENWIYILKDNMDRKLPVFYSGFNSAGGHAFVCDGYQDSAYFHFNLGWGGQSNGYYTKDAVLGFNYFQFIRTELYPDTLNYTYPLYPSGADTLTYVEGSIEDGSGPIPNYLNNHQASWLIDPQNEMDSVTNIEIMVKRLDLFNDGDRLYIYDGEDNNAPLLAELSGNIIPNDIESTGNKVFIEFYTDGANTAPGFYLNYHTTRPVWCNGITQLTGQEATFDDGSGSFYYYNTTTCTWMIDPGTADPLTLHFNYFDTETDLDVLKIYDGDSQELITEISGYYEDPPDPVTSPSGKMKLVFLSNNSVCAQGWEVWYDLNTGLKENNLDSDFLIIPNPVTSDVKINFNLQSKYNVSIQILDIVGQKLEYLVNKTLMAGQHSISHNLGHLPDGIYFCRLQVGDDIITKKIIKL